jgi:putative copper resistance protein D
VRALADCAAVGTLGLAIVPMLDTARRRDEVGAAAAGPLVVVSAAWFVAEVVRQIVAAAATAGVSATGLPVHTVVEFTLRTMAGRAGVVSIAAAAVVCALAATCRRSTALGIATAGAAVVGIAARAVSGHLSENNWGALAVAVHALAAALWCGGLAALVVTIRHRGQWARMLPRFSQLSLACVVALAVSGGFGAVLAGGAPAHWYASSYGRLLLAKVVLLAALVILAWRNRTIWLPAARAHHASAVRSQRRSLVELAVMAVALTIAAALSVTG